MIHYNHHYTKVTTHQTCLHYTLWFRLVELFRAVTVERDPHGRPGLPGQMSQTVLSPCHYLTCPVNTPEDIILKLERFVVIMYCRTSGDMNVNTAWMILFSQMSRNIDNIPPPQAALDQHIKRSSYQSGIYGDSHWKYNLNFQTLLIGDWRYPKLPVIF